MIAKGEAAMDADGNVSVVRETPGQMEGVSQSSEQPQVEGQMNSSLA